MVHLVRSIASCPDEGEQGHWGLAASVPAQSHQTPLRTGMALAGHHAVSEQLAPSLYSIQHCHEPVQPQSRLVGLPCTL